MIQLEPHDIAKHFPLLEGQQFEDFKADIAKRGLLEPIWLYQGKILDGRNRYRACCDLNIEPRTREYIGESPVSFSWSMNGTRRHLSHAQRVAIALEMLPELEAEAAARTAERYRTAPRDEKGHFIETPEEPSPERGEAAAAAGRIVGVSATSIYQAKAVRESNPEAFERIKRGETAVATAFKEGKKPPPVGLAERIRALSSEGHRPEQIAEKMKTNVKYIRDTARKHDIVLADAGFKASHSVNAVRVVEQTVSSIEGAALGLKIVESQLDKIPPPKAAEWAEALAEPLRTLTALRIKLLKLGRV